MRTLLTGATGFLGHYLLRDLIFGGDDPIVLVRQQANQLAQRRIHDVVEMWEHATRVPIVRPQVVVGDVTKPGLGLTSATHRQVDRVLHCAASLVFNNEDKAGEPWKTNVDGTVKVLEFCKQYDLPLHYVSTAYVCGKRTGLVCEGDLDKGQGHRNHYEKSKFMAEQAIDFHDEVNSTVYRPGIIAGDSKSGYTSQYSGLYRYLRVVDSVVKHHRKPGESRTHIPLKKPGTGREMLNVVPVDWVSYCITQLVNNPLAAGRTFHLTPRWPIRLEEIARGCESFYNTWGFEFCGDEEPDAWWKRMSADFEIYQQYEENDNKFDRENLEELIDDECPRITEEVLHRYLDYAIRSRWGKRSKAAVRATQKAASN